MLQFSFYLCSIRVMWNERISLDSFKKPEFNHPLWVDLSMPYILFSRPSRFYQRDCICLLLKGTNTKRFVSVGIWLVNTLHLFCMLCFISFYCINWVVVTGSLHFFFVSLVVGVGWTKCVSVLLLLLINWMSSKLVIVDLLYFCVALIFFSLSLVSTKLIL